MRLQNSFSNRCGKFQLSILKNKKVLFLKIILLGHCTQWITLQYRRLQKIEQIEPDHCDRYQNNRTKKMQLNGIGLLYRKWSEHKSNFIKV